MSQHSNEARPGSYLPSERGAIVVPFDDCPGLVDVAAEILGERFSENRLGYRLDGKACNTDRLLKAAALERLDERVTIVKGDYLLDGKPCDVPGLLRAAGLQYKDA